MSDTIPGHLFGGFSAGTVEYFERVILVSGSFQKNKNNPLNIIMSNSFKRTAIIVVAFLPVLVLGYFSFHHDGGVSVPVIAIAPSTNAEVKTAIPVSTALTSSASVSTSLNSKIPVVTANPVSAYTDGTFTAMGSYASPGGSDALGVTVTVKNDIVVAVSLVEKPSNPSSKEWQDVFASGYKVFVVGQKLTDLQLTNVSGSSLTPIGFNNALDQIRSQAKAI